jgi:hypothetical protein
MSKAKIGYEEFQVKTVRCEITGDECDEDEICTHCPIAKEYCRNHMHDEYEDMIQHLLPSADRPTKGGKGRIDPMNTLVKYSSVQDLKDDGILPDIESFKMIEHGYQVCTPVHFPRFYLLQQILNLGVPEYYLLRDHEWPVVAVYPDAVYVTAPEIEHD